MPLSPPAEKAAIPATAVPGRRGDSILRLDAVMACDTAFRMIARRSLADMIACHPATCKGDPTALHHMRIALTRLRTAILFFSPMVADLQRTRIRAELKWLNSRLGAVRDIDVAIARLKASDSHQSWTKKRIERHRGLAQALGSARYRHLIKRTSDWIEHGPWSTKRAKQAAMEREVPVGQYSTDKLAQWQQKLLKKSRKLPTMNASKRHRLRLLNKRISYSAEFFAELFAGRKFAGQRAGLKHLRRAQRALGQLNDEANARALATALQRSGGGAPPLQFLSPKRERRLLRTAEAAYRKLAALKPFET